MRRFWAKGGYGEHGRSCFLMEYGREGRYCMVDCGIMDSDSQPYPDVTSEELSKTDYLFLTHCHKDHSGAFTEFVKRGFCGVLAASQMTIDLSNISYEKQIVLPVDEKKTPWKTKISEITLTYGRTGHCPGGLWFYIEDEKGAVFFSGDYQEDTLAYACDPVRGCRAQFGVVDCAHVNTFARAKELREQIKNRIAAYLSAGKKIIMPLPHYGRGMEILILLKESFPDRRIAVDTVFLKDMEQILKEKIWYRNETYDVLQKLFVQIGKNAIDLQIQGRKMEYDILLIADTHLQKKYNADFVSGEVKMGAAVLVTGRIKPGELPEQLLDTGDAERFLYPHHQSKGDMQAVISENAFEVVLPFHNEEKEMIFL